MEYCEMNYYAVDNDPTTPFISYEESAMNDKTPEQFTNVTATCKANVYFDGKVVSHSIALADGSRKTLGLIYPGSYTFNTVTPETMEIIAGSCRVQVAGQAARQAYAAGACFEVPGDASFTIEVAAGITEYICSFK
jgi:uncharacterized protein YaiE (UPF0345 family)